MPRLHKTIIYTILILSILLGLHLIGSIVQAKEICSECEKPKPEEVCASITNYWQFDENGNPIKWDGQADGDPNHTATSLYITAEDKGKVIASFDGFTDSNSQYHGAMLKIPGRGTFKVQDRFGAPAYRQGVFWHDTYQQWVFGIDIMTDEPLHYLECNVEIIFPD